MIPVEFDTLLTRTEDHAAARAIENALGRLSIPCVRSEDDVATKRCVEIHVRAADFGTASPIAAEIFVRRKKVKSIPRPGPIGSPSASNPPDLGGIGGFGF